MLSYEDFTAAGDFAELLRAAATVRPQVSHSRFEPQHGQPALTTNFQLTAHFFGSLSRLTTTSR
jgi:hypothetical protein